MLLPFFKPHVERFVEIDALRGMAVILMVLFHFAWDLRYFGIVALPLGAPTFYLLARGTAITFLVLVGICLHLSYVRRKLQKQKHIFPAFLRRGLTIFAWGIIITGITAVAIPEGMVYFGILHLIGMSIIVAYPFVPRPLMSLIAGIALLFFGILLNSITVFFPWLLWLGLVPANLYTYDYSPLIPWFGVILIGIFTGHMLYPDGRRSFHLPKIENWIIIKYLHVLGKHSLAIYLFHQPVLAGILYLLTR